MAVFRSYRSRYLFAVFLTLAILLAQGLRIQLHAHGDDAHHDFASDIAAVHAHIDGGLATLDHDDHVTASVQVSFDAVVKLLNLNPLLALVTVALLFLLAMRSNRLFFFPNVRQHFLDPPYLSPPGHAPPR